MRTRRSESGSSLLEVVTVLALVAMFSGATIGVVTTGLDGYRSRAAARYLAGVLADARARAVYHQAAVAVRFVRTGHGYAFTYVLDGDGNGVRTDDIAAGIDPVLASPESLGERFAGLDFGIIAGLPSVDGDEVLTAGSSPLRIGRTGLVSWSPLGTATPGTLYVADTRGHQVAVRVSPSGRCQGWEHTPGGWRLL